MIHRHDVESIYSYMFIYIQFIFKSVFQLGSSDGFSTKIRCFCNDFFSQVHKTCFLFVNNLFPVFDARSVGTDRKSRDLWHLICTVFQNSHNMGRVSPI